MSERAEVSLNQIRERAEKLEQAALRQVAAVKSMLKRAGDDGARKQISETSDAIRSIGDQIQSLKAKIAKERKPVLDVLAQAEDAVLRTHSEAERLTRQIQEKEREIDRLSSITIPRGTALGEIIVPDGDARARANALRVEVAGLYRALGTAKETVADAVRTRDDLQAQVIQFPVEADPRMAELYRMLEAETSDLASLQGLPSGGALPMPPAAVFSGEQRARIAKLLRRKVKIDVPDFLSSAVFRDAIGRVESFLVEYLPAEVLNLMGESRGFSHDGKAFAARLTKMMRSAVDVPLFDDEQKDVFLTETASLIVGAMNEGTTQDALLEKMERGQKREIAPNKTGGRGAVEKKTSGKQRS